MAFDQPTRNRLARFVGDARFLLTEEFIRQLQNDYGLDPTSGEITAIEKLTALDDARRETARILRETIEYYLAGKPTDDKTRKETLERILREQAFTVLNRLCALRMAEGRGLVIESVGRGHQSKGFQLYAHLAGPALGETGEAYRCYLFSLFDELSVDLPVLFDRFSPQGRLFPREVTLIKLLEMINDAEIEPLWAEDETIGWIYQYFNSKEERQQMRAEAQAPRNSRELAVRNQFFTPRFVVEFLTDNTLGRIWYEMTRGETNLKGTCRYLVRRPNEIFLAEGEEAHAQVEQDTDFSQDQLLKQQVFIPYRPLKDPRELKMLDPACGSMHFGLYAFDLFEHIYTEAWELEEILDENALWRLADLEPLHRTYSDREAFLRDIPRLIIERNIHGIDIDPRAVQIAGLSLWLRAQKAWQAQGVKPHERPQIRKSNIVCAEPMPGGQAMLDEFLSTLQGERLEALMHQVFPGGGKLHTTKAMADALAKLVRTVWQEMELAGEAGSLLKIEETLRDAIAAARKESEEKAPLFRVLEYGLQAVAPAEVGAEADFWTQAEALVLAALKMYADQAENGSTYRRRLFVGDSAQGFAFIDLCQKKYDVALINPPFGDCTVNTRDYISNIYTNGSNDICAAFVLCFVSRLSDNGYLGAITTRLALFIQTFAEWRNVLFNNHSFSLIADLGYGVLDAMVETAVYTIKEGRKSSFNEIAFLGLLGEKDKSEALDNILCQSPQNIEWRDSKSFINVPGIPLAYWVPNSLLKRFRNLETFNAKNGRIRQGIATGDDFRFLRLRWEIPRISILDPNDNVTDSNLAWVPMSKGGEYSPWWDDIHLTLNWHKAGEEIRNFFDARGKLRSRPQNISYFFLEGGTYPYRTTSAFGIRYMPPGVAFSVGGWGVFPPPTHNLFEVIGIYNTRFARYFMEVLLGQGDASVSGTAARNHGSEAVGAIPWPELSLSPEAVEAVKNLIELSAKLSVDETYSQFVAPAILYSSAQSLRLKAQDCWSIKCELWKSIAGYYQELEKEVARVFNLTKDELNAIGMEEGLSLSEYNDGEIGHKELTELFSFSIEQLTGRARNVLGAKRYVVKKAFFVDRVIDLACHMYRLNPESIIKEAKRIKADEVGFTRELISELISWLFGCCIGRWNINIFQSLDKYKGSNMQVIGHFFEYPPGQRIPTKAFVTQPNFVLDENTSIPLDGILVDDEGNPRDIIRRLREAIAYIWPTQISDLEAEMCAILGSKSLREYFQSPDQYFDGHQKRYSKSRRQAPIYWPLSTPSRSYTLWLYYHFINDQVLFTCVNDLVDPKLRQVSEDTNRLRAQKGRSASDEKELERLTDFERELKDFRTELLRVAAFWKPNLNDGVQINASPLWKLFQHKPWQNKLKETWELLERGDYDWAHLAYSIWPERVREKCKTDKSLAIAHGLETLYVEPKTGTKKKKIKLKEEDVLDSLFDEV